MSSTPPRKEYACIYFIAILYMSVMVCSAVVANKLIMTPVGVLAAASLVSPIWFTLTDIIAEVYGYKMSRRLFWAVIICQFILAFAYMLLIRLPSPDFWHGQACYELITGHLLRIAFFAFVGNVVAWKINVLLLLRWKFLLHGRYFWLRSLGSSGIGEIIFSVLSVSLSVIGLFPMNEVISIVTWSCALKLIGLIILAPISNYAVKIIKHVEGPVDVEGAISLNPFK